jgi:hypothetical protein
VQHVVLFQFPRELTVDEYGGFLALLQAWPREIGTMSRLRIGNDCRIAGDRSRGYQYLLFMEFPSIKEVLAYRAHPAHVAFSKFIHERDCRVLAFDYELDSETRLYGD